MAININEVRLCGKVGTTPETKTTEYGTVTNLSLATNKTYLNQKGEKVNKTTWHRLVFWNKLAELVDKYVEKGSEIYVTGEIEHRTYNGKDGIGRAVTDIICGSVQFGNKPKDAEDKKTNTSHTGTKKQEQENVNNDNDFPF